VLCVASLSIGACFDIALVALKSIAEIIFDTKTAENLNKDKPV